MWMHSTARSLLHWDLSASILTGPGLLCAAVLGAGDTDRHTSPCLWARPLGLPDPEPLRLGGGQALTPESQCGLMGKGVGLPGLLEEKSRVFRGGFLEERAAEGAERMKRSLAVGSSLALCPGPHLVGSRHPLCFPRAHGQASLCPSPHLPVRRTLTGCFLPQDWPFDDGAPPPGRVVEDWLSLLKTKFCDDPGSCVAVHCVAGLGR